ncbi:MAG: hypothetical protein V7700_17385 [Halioglobus sp.]
MNWEIGAAVAEIVGAVAVVISLIYLALQIRAQTNQSRLAAQHEVSNGIREVSLLFATEDISDIFVRGNKDFDSMSDAELVRLIVAITNLFRVWEEAFAEARDGHLEAANWDALSGDYSQLMGAPSFTRVWELRKQNYYPEFQIYVDSLESREYIVR